MKLRIYDRLKTSIIGLNYINTKNNNNININNNINNNKNI